MARNTVVVSITSNNKGLQKGLGQSQSALGKLGKIAGGATKLVAGVGAALIGVATVGGFSRALKLDEANTKLKALGYSMSDMEAITDSALTSVRGTAYGLDSAVNSAVGLLAAGIKPGKELTGVLTTISNTAALAGTSMDDMGAIFNKIAANGKVTTQEMNQLADRGVPIWQYLGESIGVNNEQLRKMISAGEVTTSMFTSALGPAVEGIAGTMGGTFQGSLNNARAALGRFGAAFIAPAIPVLTALLQKFTGWVDKLAARVKPLTDRWAEFLSALDLTKTPNIGPMFAGVLDAAIKGITKAADWLATGGAQRLFDGLVKGRDALFRAASQAFPAILDGLLTAIPQIIGGLSTLLQQLVAFIADSAPKILDGAVSMFSALIDGALAILPGLLDAITSLIPNIVATVLGMLPKVLDAAVELFTGLIEAVPIILPELITTIVGLIPILVVTILKLVPKILTAAIKVFTSLVTSIPMILPNLLIEIVNMLPKIVSTIVSMVPDLIDAGIELFTTLVEAIPTIARKLGPALQQLGPKMTSAIRRMVPQLVTAGRDLIQGLVNGLWRASGRVGSALLSIAKNAVGSFLSFFGIASPSKLMAGFGGNLVQGLVKGIDQTERLAVRAIDGLSTAVTGAFDPRLDASMSITSANGGRLYGPGHAPTGNTYNITIQAVAPNAEVGRAVTAAIDAYERVKRPGPSGVMA